MTDNGYLIILPCTLYEHLQGLYLGVLSSHIYHSPTENEIDIETEID